MTPQPTSDDELLATVRQIVACINANHALWVSSPKAVVQPNTDASAFEVATKEQIAKKAASGQASEVKSRKKKVLKTNISRLKSWAEGIVGKYNPRLRELGFSALTAGSSLEKPSQPEALIACDEKPIGEVRLQSNKPSGGGKVAGYQVLLKLPAEATFSIHTTASSRAIQKIFVGQPLNALIQYRPLAFNDAGEGLPSNTVEVRL